ncbi:DeoR family transcriptional regulator [Aquicoccus sp. SU-CL01552]|uniref:DeoR family transcriptional regulator n=1 Tax=Aquicoccus sp. SU-CL01552 TaxID=3127656 RepID=UPI0033420DB8
MIIALLSEYDALSAVELSGRLAVSVQTVRADLRDLDEAAIVQRRNGKVRLRQQSENIGYLPREAIAQQEKQRIVPAVENRIPEGARVALGTGTTVEQCARFLASHENLFVASNSIHAVCALQNAPGATCLTSYRIWRGRLPDRCQAWSCLLKQDGVGEASGDEQGQHETGQDQDQPADRHRAQPPALQCGSPDQNAKPLAEIDHRPIQREGQRRRIAGPPKALPVTDPSGMPTISAAGMPA